MISGAGAGAGAGAARQDSNTASAAAAAAGQIKPDSAQQSRATKFLNAIRYNIALNEHGYGSIKAVHSYYNDHGFIINELWPTLKAECELFRAEHPSQKQNFSLDIMIQRRCDLLLLKILHQEFLPNSLPAKYKDELNTRFTFEATHWLETMLEHMAHWQRSNDISYMVMVVYYQGMIEALAHQQSIFRSMLLRKGFANKPTIPQLIPNVQTCLMACLNPQRFEFWYKAMTYGETAEKLGHHQKQLVTEISKDNLLFEYAKARLRSIRNKQQFTRSITRLISPPTSCQESNNAPEWIQANKMMLRLLRTYGVITIEAGNKSVNILTPQNSSPFVLNENVWKDRLSELVDVLKPTKSQPAHAGAGAAGAASSAEPRNKLLDDFRQLIFLLDQYIRHRRNFSGDFADLLISVTQQFKDLYLKHNLGVCHILIEKIDLILQTITFEEYKKIYDLWSLSTIKHFNVISITPSPPLAAKSDEPISHVDFLNTQKQLMLIRQQYKDTNGSKTDLTNHITIRDIVVAILKDPYQFSSADVTLAQKLIATYIRNLERQDVTFTGNIINLAKLYQRSLLSVIIDKRAQQTSPVDVAKLHFVAEDKFDDTADSLVTVTVDEAATIDDDDHAQPLATQFLCYARLANPDIRDLWFKTHQSESRLKDKAFIAILLGLFLDYSAKLCVRVSMLAQPEEKLRYVTELLQVSYYMDQLELEASEAKDLIPFLKTTSVALSLGLSALGLAKKSMQAYATIHQADELLRYLDKHTATLLKTLAHLIKSDLCDEDLKAQLEDSITRMLKCYFNVDDIYRGLMKHDALRNRCHCQSILTDIFEIFKLNREPIESFFGHQSKLMPFVEDQTSDLGTRITGVQLSTAAAFTDSPETKHEEIDQMLSALVAAVTGTPPSPVADAAAGSAASAVDRQQAKIDALIRTIADKDRLLQTKTALLTEMDATLASTQRLLEDARVVQEACDQEEALLKGQLAAQKRDYEATLARRNRTIDNQRGECSTLNTRLDALRAESASLKAECASLRAESAALKEQLDQAIAAQKAQQRVAQRKDGEIRALKARIVELEAQTARSASARAEVGELRTRLAASEAHEQALNRLLAFHQASEAAADDGDSDIENRSVRAALERFKTLALARQDEIDVLTEELAALRIATNPTTDSRQVLENLTAQEKAFKVRTRPSLRAILGADKFSSLKNLIRHLESNHSQNTGAGAAAAAAGSAAEVSQLQHRVYVDGGLIRNALTKTKPSDIDLVTTLSIEQLRAKLIGLEGFNFRQNPMMPNLFTDTTQGVDIVCCPDFDLLKAANSSDLSCNSMFLRLNGDGFDLFDPLEVGVDDVEKGKFSIVGDSIHAKFREDPCRALRLFRFHLELYHPESTKWDLSVEQKRAIQTFSKQMANVPFGRFASHIRKLFDTPNALNKGLELNIIGSLFNYDYQGISPLNPLSIQFIQAIAQQPFIAQDARHPYVHWMALLLTIGYLPKAGVTSQADYINEFLDTFPPESWGTSGEYRQAQFERINDYVGFYCAQYSEFVALSQAALHQQMAAQSALAQGAGISAASPPPALTPAYAASLSAGSPPPGTAPPQVPGAPPPPYYAPPR